MTKEEIEQRIRYLVEHGGIYDDPIDELRRTSRAMAYLLAVCLALQAFGMYMVFS